MKIKLFFILWLLFNNIAYCDEDKNQQVEINFLISYVDSSQCIFTRNGINYSGSEAIAHIQLKYDYYKDDIKTAEDFIRLSATKSEISGKKYTLQCKNKQVQELGKWLLDALKSYRKNKL